MATLLPRRTLPDLTIKGDAIENMEATAEYGWLLPADDWRGGGIRWESDHYSFTPPTGAIQVCRVHHVITERVEIVSGDRKGERIS